MKFRALLVLLLYSSTWTSVAHDGKRESDALVRELLDPTVTIVYTYVQDGQQTRKTGCGVIIASQQLGSTCFLDVLTVAHVVTHDDENATETTSTASSSSATIDDTIASRDVVEAIWYKRDERQVVDLQISGLGHVVATSTATDLALVQIVSDSCDDIPVAPVSTSSDRLHIMDDVIIAAAPGGRWHSLGLYPATVTNMVVMNDTLYFSVNQTIDKGMSGGPVFRYNTSHDRYEVYGFVESHMASVPHNSYIIDNIHVHAFLRNTLTSRK